MPEASEIPDSGAGIDLLAVTPRKVAALAIVSNEATGDANAAEMLGQALARAVAVEVDRALFQGGGTNGPAGLPSVAGVVVDVDPTSGLDPWTDAVAAVESNGARATVGLVSPATWAALSKVKESTGSNKPVLADPATGPTGELARSIGGLPVLVPASVANGEAWVVDRCPPGDPHPESGREFAVCGMLRSVPSDGGDRALSKTIYRITYPNGKIYVGMDLTGTLCYFGSVSSRLVEADHSAEQRRDFTIRKETLWESETAPDSEVRRREMEWIEILRSNDPAVGYNRSPRSRHAPVTIEPEGAYSYLRLYRVAVDQQAERILPRHHTLDEADGRWADCMLFVSAVRNAERAAVFVQSLMPPGDARDEIAEAIEQYRFLVPDVTKVRDFLEHFEQYERGVGNRFKGKQGALVYEQSEHETTISIVVYPGPWLLVPVAQTRDAVRVLAQEVARHLFPKGEPTRAMGAMSDE